MEKYGFVYLWHDTKKNKFYLGCHWGTETDGYICSSKNMRNAHAYRKQDFKRRIIERIYTSKSDLLIAEHKWLQMIKKEELGVRYYNKMNHKFEHWTSIPGATPWNKGLSNIYTEETRQKMREAKFGKPSNSPTKFVKGRAPHNKGVPMSEEQKLKCSEASKKRIRGPCSEETKRKISEAQKGKPRKSGMEGKRHSEATKLKIRETKARKRLEALQM